MVIWIVAAVLAAIVIMLGVAPLRRRFISPHIYALFKRILPPMSDTERDALEAGTTWWDADLFSGRPDWKKFMQLRHPALTTEEQSFMDNEVRQLCDMVDDWEATQVWQGLPEAAWQFARDKGFLGMIIPKHYGGKAFSAYMHSQVVMALSTRCSALAVQVMVPNSLGPAELLLHYGTDQQKDYYLPRLAKGEEIPCFALTSPYAGSDAAAIPDTGIVCMGRHEGRETLGLRVSWNKRYITLGPIATLLGLAFKVEDPQGLLPADVTPGITCALIPANHPGVVIGRRHWPLNAVFQNGPTSGKDVFIPMEWIIGGPQQIGKGWRMLMECLAAGRAISLPSASVGTAKLAVRGTSAYCAIRRQFNTPIGKFEGVQEALARMGANLYMMDAARRLSALAVDLGEKPAVISAIAKYHVTERGREVVNDGMDILGGKGICMGPSNFLGRAYQQIPIAITVEGANILTRCLIIFGQGAIRAHPYVLKEMRSTADSDQERGLRDFDAAFFGHMGFTIGNAVRALWYSLTGGITAPSPGKAAPEMRRYYRAVGRLSTVFALMTDLSMFTLGGDLKRRERISSRLGDALSMLYLISATLKRFEDEGRQEQDAAYVHWSVQDALCKAQSALDGVLANFPSRVAALLARLLAFPFGLPYAAPTDKLGGQIATAMQTHGGARERLLAGSFLADDLRDPVACGELAFGLLAFVDSIEHRLKPAIKGGALPPVPQSLPAMEEWIARAASQGLVTPEERRAMSDFARYTDLSVHVDDFPPDLNAAADAAQRRKMSVRAEKAEV
ncbi:MULTISPECIES: acyl-CoA dehydrogenase [unclassified Duganella]|uniref:acyl-CoA dehydrogenase n=1 Tax=unclassified Duganella TaxID=2636909 RepID=UPI00088CBD6F|nr:MULTISPECIES: acyl-CoA dehydrogenase [unclassified Duganella]SDG84133.1 acyl-CoA dehydrogenase [Duganella sp. OV458]SDK11583.1 acyl-CoA dehydrogenase [Duganella sp. OV510]